MKYCFFRFCFAVVVVVVVVVCFCLFVCFSILRYFLP